MDDEPSEDKEPSEDQPAPASGLFGWLRSKNQNASLVALIRRARRALPGDPEYGDPLSTAGDGGVEVAARAADRLMPNRSGATREVSLAALQLWKAVTERVSGKEPDAEVTLVFTDLVGFSTWSLEAGDEATLRLLRRVAQVSETPLLDAGGHIVKRMGDGMMAVFPQPDTAVKSTLEALQAVKTVEVEGYTPKMRAGIHTGRPQHIGSDWLGVDVNIAARVMERATKGGLIVSESTLERIPEGELQSMGVEVKKIRRNMFVGRQSGMPADLEMYRVKPVREKGKSGKAGSSKPKAPKIKLPKIVWEEVPLTGEVTTPGERGPEDGVEAAQQLPAEESAARDSAAENGEAGGNREPDAMAAPAGDAKD